MGKVESTTADPVTVRLPKVKPATHTDRMPHMSTHPADPSVPKLPDQPLPYGTDHLNSTVVVDKGPPKRIRCYVKGCTEFLRPPGNGFGASVFRPRHSMPFVLERRNVFLRRRISQCDHRVRRVFTALVGNRDKYETGRLRERIILRRTDLDVSDFSAGGLPVPHRERAFRD